MTNLEKYIQNLSNPKIAPHVLRHSSSECQACVHNALYDADCVFEYEPPVHMGQYVDDEYCLDGTISWMNMEVSE